MAGESQESRSREILVVAVVEVSSSAGGEKIDMKKCQIDLGEGKVSLMKEA